jgi:hypothetical protein
MLVRDRRIPRPLRWMGGIALLPIPGPADEAILLVLAPVMLAFYREPMKEAWREARREPAARLLPTEANAHKRRPGTSVAP